MKNYDQLTEAELSKVVGGGWGKLGGWFYTLLGEADDFKAGFRAGTKAYK